MGSSGQQRSESAASADWSSKHYDESEEGEREDEEESRYDDFVRRDKASVRNAHGASLSPTKTTLRNNTSTGVAASVRLLNPVALLDSNLKRPFRP